MAGLALLALLGLLIVILILLLTIFLNANEQARKKLIIKKDKEKKGIKVVNKCIKCEKVIPDSFLYCNYCGKKQIKK